MIQRIRKGRSKFFKLANETVVDDQDSKAHLDKPLVERSGKFPSKLISAATDRIHPRRNYK